MYTETILQNTIFYRILRVHKFSHLECCQKSPMREGAWVPVGQELHLGKPVDKGLVRNRIALATLMADRSKLALKSSSERVGKHMSCRYILLFCLSPQPDRLPPPRPLRLTPSFHACRRTFSLLTFVFGRAFFSNHFVVGYFNACTTILWSSIYRKHSTARRNQPCAKQEIIILKAPHPG